MHFCGGVPLNKLQGVVRALDVLKLLCKEDNLGVRAIAGRLGISPTVAQRVLFTLMSEGYLEQHETTRTYTLGWAAGELGNAYQKNDRFMEEAREVLDFLNEASGETAALQRLLDGTRVCVLQSESKRQLRFSMPLNLPMPVTNGATDQILRAYATEEEQERIEEVLESVVTGTSSLNLMGLDDPKTLLRDYQSVSQRTISLVRRQGFCFATGYREAGVTSVAVPVRTDRGLFALTILGPRERIPATAKKPFAKLLKDAQSMLQAWMRPRESDGG